MALPQDLQDDKEWFAGLLRGLKPTVKALVKERGYYFNFENEAEQLVRFHEFFDVFAAVLERNKAILKSSIWNALFDCYEQRKMDTANYKDDAYAFKQSLMKLVDKQRHCTTGENQIHVIQRLIRRRASDNLKKLQENEDKSSLDSVKKSSSERSLSAKTHKSILPEKSGSSKRKSLAETLFPESPKESVKRRLVFDETDEDHTEKTPPTKAEAALSSYQSPAVLKQQTPGVAVSREIQTLAVSREKASLAANVHGDSSNQKSTAANVLRMYGCSPMDKSKPRVPPASQKLLTDLLQAPSAPTAAASSSRSSGMDIAAAPTQKVKKDAYVAAKESYFATFPQAKLADWNKSEARTESINALPRAEIARRRLQKFRPDLFPLLAD